MMQFLIKENDEIYSVSALNTHLRLLLESRFSSVWVEGEISNLKSPASRHLYFSLKDEMAQLRCAWFRGMQNELAEELSEGMQVLALGRISLYETRGDCQLIVEKIIASGDGRLRIRFEQLLKKLQAKGWFDVAYKKPIPKIPKQIGIISSATGAAVHDALTALKRRAPFIPVIIYPSSVQGEKAAREIVSAIELANQRQECDVLLLIRGGGSLEDLWPFNEEMVANAIFNSDIPIVSGVGHEIDTTIADYVADVRAATPTAAAELVSPNKAELQASLERLELHLAKPLLQLIERYQEKIHYLQKRLIHPGEKIQRWMQEIDDNEIRLTVSLKRLLEFKKQMLTKQVSTLNALSPLKTLERGFAIASKNQSIVYDSRQLEKNDLIRVQFQRGTADCEVIKIS